MVIDPNKPPSSFQLPTPMGEAAPCLLGMILVWGLGDSWDQSFYSHGFFGIINNYGTGRGGKRLILRGK
ncbi:hypothetical protein AMTR_s03990p00003490, partial [Amborella trichopoda]